MLGGVLNSAHFDFVHLTTNGKLLIKLLNFSNYYVILNAYVFQLFNEKLCFCPHIAESANIADFLPKNFRQNGASPCSVFCSGTCQEMN